MEIEGVSDSDWEISKWGDMIRRKYSDDESISWIYYAIEMDRYLLDNRRPGDLPHIVGEVKLR